MPKWSSEQREGAPLRYHRSPFSRAFLLSSHQAPGIVKTCVICSDAVMSQPSIRPALGAITVATRNRSDFEKAGAKVIDPFRSTE
jgi:hypothetical protein